jgi:PhnB protein
MKAQFPVEKHNKIINAHLKSGNLEFSATDWHADDVTFKPGNTLSIYVNGNSYDELKNVFDKLSVGADKNEKTFIELREMPFGTYGQFTDRFGVPWIFVNPKK